MRPQSKRSRDRRRTIIGLAVAAVVAVSAGAMTAVAVESSGPAVDGIRFTSDELDLAAERAHRSGGGRDEDAAIETLRDDLALFTAARSLGVSDITRPSDILALLDDVNADRRETARSGGVVYGPVSYDARSFYGKTLTDIRQAAVTALSEGAGDATIDETVVRERFDSDRASWALAATSYHFTSATRADDGDAPAAVAGWDAVASGAAMSPLTLTATEIESGAISPDAAATLASAEPGDVIGPIPAAGELTYLRLDSTTVDADAAYDHYRSRIRAQLHEEQLSALVAEARARQELRVS